MTHKCVVNSKFIGGRLCLAQPYDIEIALEHFKVVDVTGSRIFTASNIHTLFFPIKGIPEAGPSSNWYLKFLRRRGSSIACIVSIGPDVMSSTPRESVYHDTTARAMEKPDLAIFKGLHGEAATRLAQDA